MEGKKKNIKKEYWKPGTDTKSQCPLQAILASNKYLNNMVYFLSGRNFRDMPELWISVKIKKGPQGLF